MNNESAQVGKGFNETESFIINNKTIALDKQPGFSIVNDDTGQGEPRNKVCSKSLVEFLGSLICRKQHVYFKVDLNDVTNVLVDDVFSFGFFSCKTVSRVHAVLTLMSTLGLSAFIHLQFKLLYGLRYFRVCLIN